MQDQQPSVLIPKIEVSEPAVQPEVQDPSVMSQPTQLPSQPKPTRKLGQGTMILFSVLAVLVLLMVYCSVAGFILYQKGMKLASEVSVFSQDAKAKDLNKIKTDINSTKNDLNSFSSSYNLISWMKFVPFAGGYVSDLGHAIKAGQAGLDTGQIVITTIQPYADLLGLQATGSADITGGVKSAQDRINFIVNTIPGLLPQIDTISGKVTIIQNEISQINPDRYPESFRGKPVKSQIENAQSLVSEADTFVVNGKPALESLPYLLGMDSPRTYLILFQNDKELRPTGGFMTAYAIMKVDKAKFQPISSNDIYNLDAQYKPSIQAPDPIVKYIKGPYILSQKLRFRDMNWSPDFAVSMATVSDAAKQVGITNIDGIIAVDTQLLENLLNVIGPIGVPGFGNFNTTIDPQCNCAQVIHELESFADIEGPVIWDPITGKIIQSPPHSDNRKKIIGPLMNSILANAMGQPKEKLPALFQAAFTSVIEKHVLFYLMDTKAEAAVSEFGMGGIIKPYDGDYLHINDANLGGRKSNLYATEEVQQDVNIASDGSVTKTVTITYKNPQSQDGWLNSVLPTWVRVYVPKGSTLITSEGLEAKQDPYEDLGKTVFAGYFQLRPQGVSKVTFQYKLPFKVSKSYNLLIQKQPGTDGFLYTVNVGRHTEEFYLKTDKELKIAL